MTRTVRIEADLTAATGGEEIRIRGYGDRLVLDCPSFGAVRRARDAVDALPRPAGVDPVAGDIAIDVRVRGASVARIAPDATPGALSRLVGAAPARVSLVGLLRALAR